MATKYIFLDIDGTLVGYDAQIPASALEALQKAQKNGHKLIIASGRSRSSIYPQLFEALEFDGVICSGGAHVICNGKTVFESLWTQEEKQTAADYFHRMGAHFIMMNRDRVFVEPNFWSETVPRLCDLGVEAEILHGAYDGALVTDRIEHQPDVQKALYFFADKSPAGVAQDLNGRFSVTDFSLGKVDGTFLFGEMSLAGVNKGDAIRRYLAHVGAEIEDSIGFGDSANDTEMMRTVGFSVAMGNGTPPIKAMADWVTTAVDADGIRNALDHMGLI